MLSLAAKMDTDVHTYLAAIKDTHGKDYKRYIPYYAQKLQDLKGRDGMWFRRERIPIEEDTLLRAIKEYTATVRDIQRRETRLDYIPRSYFYNCKFSCEYHDLCAAEFQGLDIDPLIRASYEFSGERYGKEDLLDA
jgi:hypothetical protein